MGYEVPSIMVGPVETFAIKKEYEKLIPKDDKTLIFRGKFQTLIVKCADDQAYHWVSVLSDFIYDVWRGAEEDFGRRAEEQTDGQVQRAIEHQRTAHNNPMRAVGVVNYSTLKINAVFLLTPALWAGEFRDAGTHIIPVAQR